MRIVTADEIRSAIDLERDLADLIAGQRQAFVDFSCGRYEVPMPLQLRFLETQSECHVKAAFRKDGDVFVIKTASSSDGAILVLSQVTGRIQAILCDGGWLTTLRTALAAAVSAEITPWEIQAIGIIGTGHLAAQVKVVMAHRYPSAEISIWGRDLEKVKRLVDDSVRLCQTPAAVVERSDIVITATASTQPIIKAHEVTGRKHIIALGADDAYKQECDPLLLGKADCVVVDSRMQACAFGDAFHAICDRVIGADELVELGAVLQRSSPLDAQLIVTDLTGIAPQDVAIASWLIQRLLG